MSLRSTLLIPLLAWTIASCGCSPSFYRRQADQEANCLIDQKSIPAEAMPGEHRINIDPRSRMFDPFDPDCEPMPPDDPASAKYLECVDGKRGSADWRKLPKTAFVDSPCWQDYLPRSENNEIVIDQDVAMDLALLHSTDYQENLEDLYLSALDVTFERFRFDTQFFGGSQIVYQNEGTGRGGDSTLHVAPASAAAGPSIDFNRYRAETLTATGGDFVVGLANSLVWQFAGPDDYTGTTLLDFSLVQPLLRAGGRTVVLERLTIAERALLANVRQMERFRRGFYLETITGRDAGRGPSRRGGFFGGAGLEGFTGVGGGGFGRVGNTGGGVTGGAGAQQAGGFLGLLQDQQELRNQRANVTALKASVVQLEATFEAGRIDRFQVDLARQALYNAQSLLLQREIAYQGDLELFLVRLGLPPELEVIVQDPYLDQFNLLEPQLEALKEELAAILDLLRTRRQELREAEEAGLEIDQEFDQDMQATLTAFQDLTAAMTQQVAAVEQDFVKLESTLPQRRESLKELISRPEVVASEIDTSLLSVTRLDEYVESRRAEIDRLKNAIDQTTQDLLQLAENPPAELSDRLKQTIDLLSRASGELLELSLLQASIRLESVTIDPIELQAEQALAIASAYRRDWKNARANLVDSWRLIRFNANALESGVDLVFNGDIGNVGQNPFDIRDDNSQIRVGLRFDAPITRLAERNVYRQSLIEYQQARRGYYEFRDGVYLGLRNTLRQVRLNEINLELRRAAVQLAISQVDLTQLRLSEPPKPGETAEFSNTTARDLVQSLSDLLNVQNDFLSVWVDYSVQQMSLEFDLGIMEVDSEGKRVLLEAPYDTYLTNLPVYPSDLYPGQSCTPPLQTVDSAEVLPAISDMSSEIIEEPEPLDLERLPPPEEPQSDVDSDELLQPLGVEPLD